MISAIFDGLVDFATCSAMYDLWAVMLIVGCFCAVWRIMGVRL